MKKFMTVLMMLLGSIQGAYAVNVDEFIYAKYITSKKINICRIIVEILFIYKKTIV